ncbi:MAG: hypothetical protein FJY07_02150 [Bacteroidetes bacterium]|nr:hypothetical protein [Bacteroidota bacterium]
MPYNLIRTVIVFTAVFFAAVVSFSENANYPLGGRSAAMGNASVTLYDFWSVHNNQAGLAGYKHISAGIAFDNRFLIGQLGTKAFAFVLPVKSGVFGINYNYFGYAAYNESKAGLAFAKSFGSAFAAGLQLDYLRTAIAENYGNRSLLTFEVGLRSEVTKKLVLAMHIFNPIAVKIEKKFNERTPAVYKFGIGWQLSDQVLVTAETEKSSGFKPLIRGGVEYKPAEKASIRLGYSSLPSVTGEDDFSIASLYSFGFGLKLNKLTIDFSASVHQILGWSPAISLVYLFQQSK